PDVIVSPLGSGLLLTSLEKGHRELSELGEAPEVPPRLVGSQPAGCAPIVRGFESADGRPKPVRKPDTIAESLAIGDPGSGFEAVQSIRETHGFADAPTDPEILEGVRLLARNGLKTPAVWGNAFPPLAPIPATLAAVDGFLGGRARG
ncbi:MAG: pyridoxal-phosphate dependent enzyme, partial [Methanobacteriota archaeon]